MGSNFGGYTPLRWELEASETVEEIWTDAPVPQGKAGIKTDINLHALHSIELIWRTCVEA